MEKIELVPIMSVKPHPENKKIHPEVNIQSIMHSLKHHEQKGGIHIGRHYPNCILAGNGTWEAMCRLGRKTIKIIRVDLPSKDHEISYMLAANATAETSVWDTEGVGQQLIDLQNKGVDLAVTGFSPMSLEPLLVGGMPDSPGDFEVPAGVEDLAISGVGDALGRLILVYRSEEEKERILSLLGLKETTKIAYLVEEVPALAEKESSEVPPSILKGKGKPVNRRTVHATVGPRKLQ